MATTIQDYYSVITKAGTQAIMSAGTSGPLIDITGFRIGARSAAQGAVADKNDTDVDDFVYSGDSTAISYQVLPDSESCMFQIVLDESVGDFTVGQIGLMAGNTLFSKSVLFRTENKWKSELPGRYGNTITFNIILTISDVESCINLTILRSLYASLPQVETENDLPLAATSLYNTYVVRNHTKTGTEALASKRNNQWNFTTMRPSAGNGEAVIPVGSTAFDASVKINMSVYYDSTAEKYLPADVSDVTKHPVGVRSSTFEVMTCGLLHRYNTDDIWPVLNLGNLYSTGSSANIGKPILSNSAAPYGLAVSQDSMFVDFGYQLYRNTANKTVVVGPIPIDRTHGHLLATQTVPGFMSAEDKSKLDGFGNISLMSSV